MSVPEHPFSRTQCACRRCSLACEHLPGSLAPGDPERLASHLGYNDVSQFALDHLCVSEGATVAVERNAESIRSVISLPTLVPLARSDGSCHWLERGRCSVHAVSPFGCAYLDAHQTGHEADRRSQHMLSLVLHDHDAEGPYLQLTQFLTAQGCKAPHLDSRQYRYLKAWRREFRE